VSSFINIKNFFDSIFAPELLLDEQNKGSDKTHERINQLGLNKIKFDANNQHRVLDNLSNKVLSTSKNIKEPYFSSSKEEALKTIDFCELFCLYAVQSKMIKIEGEVNQEVHKEIVKTHGGSTQQEILFQKIMTQKSGMKTVFKAIEELELIKNHVENNSDKETIKIISKRFNKHLDKLFTHCLGPLEQETYGKVLKEAKGVLKKI
jgi:hypothetical protein